jgi:hypothetical protein
MNLDETTVGFIEHALRDTEEGGALGAEGRQNLHADAQALGLFGLLVAAALGPTGAEIEAEVRAELPDGVRDALSDALAGADGDLDALTQRYLSEKGARGPELLARLIARVAYELYELRDHGFLQEDALLATELLAAGRAQTCAREAAHRTTRLGRTATRTVLGHLDSQLDIVHRLGNQQQPLVWAEIDRRVGEFAPRVFAQRWPSMASRLLIDDKRFRFVCVLWGRLRGVSLGRAAMIDLAQRIDPKRPMLFIQTLEESALMRKALIAADGDSPHAATLEAALRAREFRAGGS